MPWPPEPDVQPDGQRDRRILRRVGYDVVAKDEREEYAEEVLAAVYDNRIEEFERE